MPSGLDNLGISGPGMAAVFAQAAAGPIKNVSSTNYTLTLGDQAKYLRMTNAAASVVNIPTNAQVPIPVGSKFEIEAAGAGGVTITPGSGVTANPAAKLTEVQWGVVRLRKYGTNSWTAY